MKTSAAWLVIALIGWPALSPQYQQALPGYRYEFPRDHFDHPEFQTEWWYYTGNLKSADGHRFGFELTFFRQAVERAPTKGGAWDLRDVYLAHLALSDLDGAHFYHSERLNRAGPDLAGISEQKNLIWNGNWQVHWRGTEQELQAIDESFALHFDLRSEKPPVIHGEQGVSQKGDGEGRASHYISLTRLATNGEIELNGRRFAVSGLAWMDHEFFTNQLAPDQVGWDWISLQLEDHTELMLFRIRRRDGSIDSFSAGTFVNPQGGSTHLRAADFTLQVAAETWTSPTTHAVYPIHRQISVPKLDIDLDVTTPLATQEMSAGNKIAPNYWEGAIQAVGRKGTAKLKGVGYLEMTGYDPSSRPALPNGSQ